MDVKYTPVIPLLNLYLKEVSTYIHPKKYIQILLQNFTYKIPKLEAIKMPIDIKMDKLIVEAGYGY